MESHKHIDGDLCVCWGGELRMNQDLGKHLERDALDLLQLLHELLGVKSFARAGGVGVGHAVLVLNAVLAARRDVLVRRLHVVEDACASGTA